LVDHLNPVRSEAFAPLTQVLLTVDATPPDRTTDESMSTVTADGLTIEPMDPGGESAKVDLTVGFATDGPGRPWRGSMIYATDLFDAGTARSMVDRLVRTLTAVTAAPQRAIGDAPLLDEGESADLTPVSGGPGTEPVVLADLFSGAARRWPDRVAVHDAHGVGRTYAELDERSNRLARWLIGQGIGVE
ncbi:hypothetical protein G3I15_40370, partial [Streptomyces sp. SID10244]|nr:hypothetical protein [Streptomyces sp. SID10244]